MKNRSKIIMVILLVVVCLALSLQAQAGESDFSCRKLESHVALTLKVTNNGPDTVKKGTVVYYFYTLPQETGTHPGEVTLDHKVKKGETFLITTNADWKTRIIGCGATLNPD